MTDLPNDPIKPMKAARPRRPSPSSENLLHIAAELTNSMDELGREISHLAQNQKRSNRIIHGIIGSVAFDIALSIGLIFAGISANNSSHQAHALSAQAQALSVANKVTLYTTCLRSNQTRADDIILWTQAVALSTSSTPAAKAKFQAFVDSTFKPAICGPNPNK